MRTLIVILLATILLAGCNKKYTYSCEDPVVVLEKGSYTAAEWDTIIVYVYDKGFQPPATIDTFTSDDSTKVLRILPVANYPKDIEIIIPAANDTYRMNNINLLSRHQTPVDEVEVACYSGAEFTINGTDYNYNENQSLIKHALKP